MEVYTGLGGMRIARGHGLSTPPLMRVVTMSPSFPLFRRAVKPGLALVASAVLALGCTALIAGPANADTTIDGPIDLGTAAAFSVLGAAAVTNTGPSVLDADLGVSPQTSVTGFPPGIVNGATHVDAVAAQAQADTGTAYDVAASLSPTASGLTDLVGYDPVPGVYSGNALTLSGHLTLNGNASSVWVFQAASSLITSSGSTVQVTGGASACNVFWQVGSSATLGVGSTMVGTVMALASISTGTATTVAGRLLARTGAVTLDTTAFTLPSGCGSAGTVSSSPTITSGAPPSAQLGVPYAFAIVASGSAVSSFSVTSGAMAPGLTLDGATGVVAGTQTVPGAFPVTITAVNGVGPAATASYSLLVTARLAATGVDATAPLGIASAAVLTGLTILIVSRRRRPQHRG